MEGREVDRAHLVDEAADVAIALINYANSRGIDLALAVEGKMVEIEARRRSEQLSAGPTSDEQGGES